MHVSVNYLYSGNSSNISYKIKKKTSAQNIKYIFTYYFEWTTTIPSAEEIREIQLGGIPNKTRQCRPLEWLGYVTTTFEIKTTFEIIISKMVFTSKVVVMSNHFWNKIKNFFLNNYFKSVFICNRAINRNLCSATKFEPGFPIPGNVAALKSDELLDFYIRNTKLRWCSIFLYFFLI